jgi:hypothetical protein
VFSRLSWVLLPRKLELAGCQRGRNRHLYLEDTLMDDDAGA